MVVMIAMEDKVYGQGRPGSIINHPVLDSFPALRDIAKNRRDRLVGPTARRMEAAFRTLTNFDPKKPPTQGVSSFDRVLGGIDEAEDLWVVMAGLNLRLQIEAHKNSPNPPAIQ
jgi:hypothetical protein